MENKTEKLMRSATAQNIGKENGRVFINYKDGSSFITPVMDKQHAHIVAETLWRICKVCGTLEV